MKTLTKEDLPIGTKVVPHDKTYGCYQFKKCRSWNREGGKEQGFLYVKEAKDSYLWVRANKDSGWLSVYNYSDVTLYEPTPKIKKSELLNRIEVLEKKVAELEEKSKVTIVYPPTWANDPSTVIGKGTIEFEAKKPRMTVKERDELAKPFNPDEYKIGTIGIFWDGDLDERIKSNSVLFGKLGEITSDGCFIRKPSSISWDNFKPIKID